MWPTEGLDLIFLATGFLVGWGHCIGMCGPIVVSFSLGMRGKGSTLPHLLYNSGRMTTYVFLGALMGATGSFAAVAARIAALQKGAMILTGGMIAFMGLGMCGWIRFPKFIERLSVCGRWLSPRTDKPAHSKTVTSYYFMGLLLGLLPCGPVYTALLASARAGMEANTPAGGMLTGAKIMLCFGLGTVPALLLVAKLADFGGLKFREIIYKAGGGLMLLTGGYFIYRGILF